jgi:uncharacterized membrane-anchored protein
MLKAPLRILIVAALCMIALVSLVVRESMARAAGTEVLLAMEAVDPRALLSGHYVIVALQERRQGGCAPPPSLDEDEERELASYRWLALDKNGIVHSVTDVARTRDEALAEGDVAVLGTTECADVFGPENTPPQSVNRLDLGVSRFHINQTDAERIDAMLREQTADSEQRIFAIVSISRDGRARLKGLMIDGERLELSWL